MHQSRRSFLGSAESCHAYAAASRPAKELTVVIPAARSEAISVHVHSARRRDLEWASQERAAASLELLRATLATAALD